MATTIAQRVVKGDIIIERDNGKNRMIPVRKVQHTVCSRVKVHINDLCYDWNAVVQLVDGEGTVKDLEAAIDELEEYDAFPTDEDLRRAGEDSIKAWADQLVRA
jgi:hypothetical protein